MGDIISMGMIASLFIGIFVISWRGQGLKETCICFGMVLLILLWVTVACFIPEWIK